MSEKLQVVLACYSWEYEAGSVHIGAFFSIEGAKAACETHFKEREIEDILTWKPYYQREDAPSQNEETQFIHGTSYSVFWDEVQP